MGGAWSLVGPHPTSYPVMAGGVVFCDVFDLEGSGDYGCGSSCPCNGRIVGRGLRSTGADSPSSIQWEGSRSTQARRWSISDQDTGMFSEQDSGWSSVLLYNLTTYAWGFNSGLSGSSLINGGEFGVLGERVTHPKPTVDLFKLGFPKFGEMVTTDTVKVEGSLERNNREATLDQEGLVMKPDLNEVDL
jgi:hypothetical protein